MRPAFHGEIPGEQGLNINNRENLNQNPNLYLNQNLLNAHSQSRLTRSPSRPTHSQSRPADNPSRQNFSQFRPTEIPSRPNHSHTRPLPGPVSIQNKQTLGRRQITDEGPPYFRPHDIKEKLVNKGFVTRDEDVKNRNSHSMADSFGLLVQDPHASVSDNKNLRRRSEHLNTRARHRQGD